MVEEVRKILERDPEPEVRQPILPMHSKLRFVVDWEAADEARRQDKGHPATNYILDRGFTPKTLRSWHFGYDDISDRIVLPVHDEYGFLVGYKGRAWSAQRKPKYLVLGDRPNRQVRYGWPCYHTSRIVFGYRRTRGHKQLIVCEGELNAVALSQHGFPCAVAVNGSTISDTQISLIRARAERAILFFDSDSAGDDGAQTLAAALKPFMPVFLVSEHEGDPASMDYGQIADCLSNSVSITRHNLVVTSKTRQMQAPPRRDRPSRA